MNARQARARHSIMLALVSPHPPARQRVSLVFDFSVVAAGAHIDSYRQSAFMPPHLPPLERVSPAEWRESFSDLIYRLHDLLHPSTAEEEPEDIDQARLIFAISREVRVSRLLAMTRSCPRCSQSCHGQSPWPDAARICSFAPPQSRPVQGGLFAFCAASHFFLRTARAHAYGSAN